MRAAFLAVALLACSPKEPPLNRCRMMLEIWKGHAAEILKRPELASAARSVAERLTESMFDSSCVKDEELSELDDIVQKLTAQYMGYK